MGLLEETLNEEKETDLLLTEISDAINPQAGGERSAAFEKSDMKPMRRTSTAASRSQSSSRQPARASSKRKR
jgi:hypothetical protein